MADMVFALLDDHPDAIVMWRDCNYWWVMPRPCLSPVLALPYLCHVEGQ